MLALVHSSVCKWLPSSLHSTYCTRDAALPKSFSCALQMGHQAAPYMVAPLLARQRANSSRSRDSATTDAARAASTRAAKAPHRTRCRGARTLSAHLRSVTFNIVPPDVSVCSSDHTPAAPCRATAPYGWVAGRAHCHLRGPQLAARGGPCVCT